MGILYDIYYPHSRDFDRATSSKSLDRLEKQVLTDPRLVGTRAVELNGDGDTLILQASGAWIVKK